jgi:H+/Cl- antiporter ClcA
MGLRNGIDWLAVPLCGVAGGLAGGLFSRLLIAMAQGFSNPVGRTIKRYPVVFAAICGLAMALCGLASDGAIYGTGYQQVKTALESGSLLPSSFGGLKFLATAFSSISGMPGGIFSPSLAVGAGLGSDIASLFHGAAPGAIMLLGMVSYFAGVVQAPITAFVIVTEMTDNHAMVVPLMAAALIAHASSRLVCSEGIYHALARGFVAREAEREGDQVVRRPQ